MQAPRFTLPRTSTATITAAPTCWNAHHDDNGCKLNHAPPLSTFETQPKLPATLPNCSDQVFAHFPDNKTISVTTAPCKYSAICWTLQALSSRSTNARLTQHQAIPVHYKLSLSDLLPPQNWGYPFGGDYSKDGSILGSILGSPYSGKLTYIVKHNASKTPISPTYRG